MKRNVCLLLACLAFLCSSWGFAACSHTPEIYTLPPEAVEKVRSHIGNVGVVVAPYKAERKFRMPAKGVVGGAGRGLVVGAALPVAAGLASPIPFGSIIGLLFVPITAPVGMVYGAAKAVPAEEVEGAEVAIDQAADRLEVFDTRGVFQDEIVRLGSERTGLRFVAVSDIGPKDPKEVVPYNQLDMPGIDTVLELSLKEGGLWGLYTINPSSSAFLEIRVRLIAKRDNEVLLEDRVTCASEEKKYTEWAEREGQDFYDDMVACIPLLTEKVVDDFFLVYPLVKK
jgi:hypothetical protein